MSDDISGATKTDPELDKVYDSVAGGWPGFVPDEQMKPYFRCRAKSKCLIGCGGLTEKELSFDKAQQLTVAFEMAKKQA